jgi:hypothetical protein
MTKYANLSGGAGIAAYEIGADSIAIKFNSGETYLYNYASAGRENIERMKSLAAAGRGLTTFISQVVKMGYDRKLR